jgi:hypothetical protein
MRCCLVRLDAQRAQQIHHVFQIEPAPFERRNSVLNTTGLRPLAVFYEVLASPANTVDLFGQIDRLEPRQERPDQIPGQCRRTTPYAGS